MGKTSVGLMKYDCRLCAAVVHESFYIDMNVHGGCVLFACCVSSELS